MTSTARRVTLSVAVVAALTGVAACGSSGSGKGDGKASGDSTVHLSPVAAVLRSVQQSTDKADSAKVRADISLGDVMKLTENGSFDWSDGLKGNVTVDYTGGKMAEMMSKAGGSSMAIRYLQDGYYAKMSDNFARQAGGGKHWIKYDYDYLAKAAGASGAFTKEQLQSSTPNQSVKVLLASGDVKEVGRQTVDGTQTRHYAGTVDVAALAGETGNLTAAQLSELKQQLTKSGITTETVDVWINDQNLLVKQSVKAATANGTLTTTAHYSDYGVPVSAEAPPASDTLDIADMMKSAGVDSPSGGTTSGGTGLTS